MRTYLVISKTKTESNVEREILTLASICSWWPSTVNIICTVLKRKSRLFNCQKAKTNPSKGILGTLVVVPHSKRSQLSCSAERDFYFMALTGSKWNQPHVFIAHRHILAINKSAVMTQQSHKSM
jgi:hypothetical protein